MNIVPVSFHGKDVRVTLINGEPWFCAVDISKVMGIINIKSNIHSMGIEYKKLRTSTEGGSQQMIYIPESGVYKILFNSRKPKVKEYTEKLMQEMGNTIGDARKVIDALSRFEVPEEMNDMFVYAIREVDTGNIKLGISKDPEKRIKYLQIGNSSELELIGMFKAENGFKDERMIHDKNSGKKIRGEWFHEGVDMYEFN